MTSAATGASSTAGIANCSDAADLPSVLIVCTGNAARSVMAGAMLAAAPVHLVTAGTHVVEGQPMGPRTREALRSVGYSASGHRSRQLTGSDLDRADLVLAMAGDHVAYVRRRHPAAAGRTASIKRLCRFLPSGPPDLAERVRRLELASVEIEPWEDVEDPAGGEADAYLTCAKELVDLCVQLGPLLT